MNIFSTYYKQIAEIPIMECKRRIEEIITHGERYSHQCHVGTVEHVGRMNDTRCGIST